MSIYTCNKNASNNDEESEYLPTFTIRNVSRNDKRALELIGVRNSSVFLSNCTIWVEGITDRLYLRHYLDLFMKKNKELYNYKEDIHYSFVEYGGGNITHFSFLDDEDGIEVESLCGKLFLVADQDEGKGERHTKLEEVLKDRFYRLDCHEVENLLSPKILQKMIWEYEGEEVAELYDYDDYKGVYLGAFIENKLAGNRKRKRSYKAESGTVTDKVGFCRKAIKYTIQFDDLSEEAKELARKMYEFIAGMNGGEFNQCGINSVKKARV